MGASFSEGNWEVDKEKLTPEKPGEKGEVTFEKSLENGLKVLKRYRFHAEDDIIDTRGGDSKPHLQESTLQFGLEWIGKIALAKLADEGNKDFGLNYAFLKNQKVEKKEFGGASSGGCVPSCGPQKTTIESF